MEYGPGKGEQETNSKTGGLWKTRGPTACLQGSVIIWGGRVHSRLVTRLVSHLSGVLSPLLLLWGLFGPARTSSLHGVGAHVKVRARR